MHESKLYEDNIFLTLTYDNENLKSDKLQYLDFQLFMKSLREKINRGIEHKENKIIISYMVTGEYGEEKKRPHWHAIIFNYRPKDQKKLRETELGETVYESKEIDSLWKKGKAEYGSVTMESASYVARYAAKKLVHGNDQEHDYHPIHKTSSKHAIGKRWIEQNYKHVSHNGFVILPNGQTSKIPRYYIDWMRKNQPEAFMHYQAETLPKIIKQSKEKQEIEEEIFKKNLETYKGGKYPKNQTLVKNTILKLKFKKLQEQLKL